MNERSKILEMLMSIIQPYLKYVNNDSSRIVIPGGQNAHYGYDVSGLECFARLVYGFWPLVYSNEVGSEEFVRIYNNCMILGTNENSTEYWGDFRGNDQREVEMIPLVMMLFFNRKKTWDVFSRDKKNSINKWFLQINNKGHLRGNWIFFRLIVNEVFKKLGCNYSENEIRKSLDLIDKLYLGEGWYEDGISTARDYYIPWGFHYYSLLYTLICDNEAIVEKYRERAILFADHFINWFSEDGKSVPYGRSLTYRFADAAFWSMFIFAKVNYPEIGIIKNIIINNLNWWANNPIQRCDGTLSIGYTYENSYMGENYNSWGSPLWALKTFIILAIDKNDLFWHTENKKIINNNRLVYDDFGEHFISLSPTRKHVCLFPNHNVLHKFENTESKYHKFVYSSEFGFCVRKSLLEYSNSGLDSVLAVSIDEKMWIPRTEITNASFFDGALISEWNPYEGVFVKAYIVPCLNYHLRIYVVNTKIKILARDGGFCIQNRDVSKTITKNSAIINNISHHTEIECIIGNGYPDTCILSPNSNILFPKAIMPYIEWEIRPGCTIFGTKVTGDIVGEGKYNNDETFKIEKKQEEGYLLNVDNHTFIISENAILNRKGNNQFKRIIKRALSKLAEL